MIHNETLVAAFYGFLCLTIGAGLFWLLYWIFRWVFRSDANRRQAQAQARLKELITLRYGLPAGKVDSFLRTGEEAEIQ